MTVAQRTMGAPSHLLFDVVEALRQVRAREAAGPCTKSIRIKVLRNYSAEFVEPFLKYYFGRIGVGCTVAFGGYDTIHQELLAGDGLRDHDLVLLSLVLEPLQAADEAAAGGAAGDILARVTGMIDLVLERTAAPVVLNTFIRPILDAEGAAGAVRAESASSRVAEINQGLRAHAREKAPRCLLIDFERLLMLVGLEAAIDRRMGYVAGAPFRHGFLSAYAYEVFRIGRALAGAAKKCLILDCDNTLWGGVVGEVGLEGIDLDRNQYPGKAFYDFQKAIVRLAGEGVMVALCSKNNLDDVMEVLDRHPHCLLKRRHLVGYRIDWQDKERNIEALVEELNIGMDAVLFVDDSPVERERIQAFLPDITVRTVPKQLYDLPLLLAREGLFDKLAVTGEDEKRARLYQAEAQRREVAAAFASVDEFLGSLELKARIEPANASRVPRVSQLTQKTNQFNLTTRRYSEGEVAAMLASADYAVFTLTAGDKFGDIGLTGVFIARRNQDEAVVDTLLMSCRALGRKLERQFVVTCIEALDRRWQPQRWRAEYVKTRKNGQVAAFWPTFGFIAEADGETTQYVAERNALRLEQVPYIQVEAR